MTKYNIFHRFVLSCSRVFLSINHGSLYFRILTKYPCPSNMHNMQHLCHTKSTIASPQPMMVTLGLLDILSLEWQTEFSIFPASQDMNIARSTFNKVISFEILDYKINKFSALMSFTGPIRHLLSHSIFKTKLENRERGRLPSTFHQFHSLCVI